MTQALYAPAPHTSPLRRGTPSLEDALAALDRALETSPVEGLVRFSVPVKPVALTTLLSAFPGRDAVLFEPPRGMAIAGVGVAVALRASGACRFEELTRASHDLFEQITPLGDESSHAHGPRLVGGAAFRDGEEAPEWSSFGDACFVLPRLSYTAHRGQTQLHLLARAEEGPAALLGALKEGLLALQARASSTPAPTVDGLEHLPRERYREELTAIQDAIRTGRVSKAVLARRSSLRLDGPADAAVVLDALARRHPSCTRFALRLDGATFFGATPERLVRREGDAVRTEALAGTVALGHAEELLHSQKEGGEHRFVVSAIDDALRPFCSELERDEAPRLRRLADVLHMETRFRGTLSDRPHVLRLVDALHPTPAVGGTPTVAALELLRSVEAEARGFYSGPFGVYDSHGDGTFVVALRSGLIADRQAFVYAGAGIVQGSQADAEYAETELKMRAVLGALEAAPREGGAA